MGDRADALFFSDGWMKPYSELSRRGRLFRMRELARTALNAYGMENARLEFLQYFGNIIYRVDIPGDGSIWPHNEVYRPNRYILRIHAMSDMEAISSEMTWLAALSQGADLPVPAPVPTLDGSLLVKLHTEAISKERVITLMRWLDGRRYEAGLRPKHIQALGEVLARMHVFAADWQPPAGFSRPHWDWDSLLGGSLFEGQVEERIESMPSHAREPFQAIFWEARSLMASLGKGPDAYGMIHADLFPENILFRRGKAYPIDFEDCGFGYWMCDIAVALSHWAWREEWEVMREAFHTGYSQVRSLPEGQWTKLDLFVAIQFASYMLWFSEFLAKDPQRADEYEPLIETNASRLMDYMKR